MRRGIGAKLDHESLSFHLTHVPALAAVVGVEHEGLLARCGVALLPGDERVLAVDDRNALNAARCDSVRGFSPGLAAVGTRQDD